MFLIADDYGLRFWLAGSMNLEASFRRSCCVASLGMRHHTGKLPSHVTRFTLHVRSTFSFRKNKYIEKDEGIIFTLFFFSFYRFQKLNLENKNQTLQFLVKFNKLPKSKNWNIIQVLSSKNIIHSIIVSEIFIFTFVEV